MSRKKKNKKAKKEVEINVEEEVTAAEEITPDEENENAAKDDEKLQEEPLSEEDKNYLEMLQRLKAEFDNYKKRSTKEKQELAGFIKSQLIMKLLPVIDDFERMFDHSYENEKDQSHSEFIKGSEIIIDKFLSILKDEGLEKIESVGEKFDPNLHEALFMEPTKEGEDNIVLEEFEKGYLFDSKLVRPVKVKVSKKE